MPFSRHLAWACLLPVSVPAQVALAPVTVSATRTEAAPFEVPAAIDVVDGARWRDTGRPQLNVGEALATVPGLVARDRQNQAQDLQLSIRGYGARSAFGVRGLRVLVDGIPATLPDGQGQLSHIDTSAIEQVEVLRGPYSVLHGNAAGGLVQVATARGDGPPTAEVDFATGSDGFRRTGLRGSGGTEAFAWRIGASRFDTDGSRAQSAARRDVANGRFDWDLEGGRSVMLVANALDLRAQDPLGLSRAQFEADPASADPAARAFDTRKTVRQQQLGLVATQRTTAGDRWRALVYGGQRDTVQFQAIPVAAQASPLHPGGVIDLARRYAGADLRWSGRRAGIDWVAGLAHDTLREDRRGVQNFRGGTLGVQGALRRDEANRTTSTDPYLQASWNAGERWTVNAGVRRSTVRIDSHDRYVNGPNGDDSAATRFAATLPVLGVRYAVTPAVALYAAAGRGFETPTLNELAYRPNGQGGLQDRLRPARSRHQELGAKGRHQADAWSADWAVTAFTSETDSEIVTLSNQGGRSTFQNAGATRRRGAELSAAVEAGAWRLQAAHTRLDARYTDGFLTCAATPCAARTLAIPAGNRIPGTARDSSAVELAWRAGPWRAGGDVRRVSAVPVNDANSDAAAAYSVWGAYAGYVLDAGAWRWTASARVDNLLDRRYAGSVIVNEGNGRFFEPGAGRSLVLGLNGQYRFF